MSVDRAEQGTSSAKAHRPRKADRRLAPRANVRAASVLASCRRLSCSSAIIALALSVLSPILSAPRALAQTSSPVTYWGEIGYDFRFDSLEGAPNLTQHIGRLSVNGTTYVWQPWLAQFDAGIGVALREEDREPDNRSGVLTTGNARLKLFPASRFPFEAFAERTDSDIDGEITGFDLETTRYGVAQRYTTVGGTALRVRAERTEQQGTTRGEADRRDVSDLLQLGFSRSFDNHNISIDSNFNQIEREETQERVSRIFSSARHDYRPSPALSVNNLFTFSDTRFDREDLDFETSFLQFNSFSFWRPDTEKPLLVNGSLRYLGIESEVASRKSRADAVTATVGSIYELTPQWSATGDFGFTQRIDDDGADDLQHFQTLGTRYTSDSIPLGAFEYSWSGGGEISNISGETTFEGTRQGAVQGIDLEFGHDLDYRTPLSGGTLTMNVGQGVDMSFDTSERSVQTLIHSAGLSWSRFDWSASTFARLSANDARTFGGGGRFGDEESEFQIINFQLSREQQITRDSTWSGNLTVQATRQDSAGGAAPEWRPIASADLTYRHRSLFGVPRLHFRSTLRFLSDAYVPLLQDPVEPNDRNNKEWENRLEYSIGRLDLELIGKLSDIGDRDRALVLFRLTRRFGSF